MSRPEGGIGTAAYLGQHILLVVRFVLQALVRGSAGLRGRGLAGPCGGTAGHAARSHTQSEAEQQQHKPGHEGATRRGSAPREDSWSRGRGWSPRAAAQSASSRWARPSEAGGCAPEPLVISPQRAALAAGRRKEGAARPPSAPSSAGGSGGRGGPGRGGWRGSRGAARGEPGARGARDGRRLLGAGAAGRSQREGGASIVPAAEVQPVTARGPAEEEREVGAAPPPPAGPSGRCAPAGGEGRAPLASAPREDPERGP